MPSAPGRVLGLGPLAAVVALTALGVASPSALAAPPGQGQRQLFALVVGVNQSLDADQPPLRYADDDAIRFRELLQLHGAEVELLTRADANTRRLHPQASAQASPPVAAELRAAVGRLRQAMARSRRQGARPTLYLFYAGHGQVKGGQGYLALEDSRLTTDHLATLLAELEADESHLIVDACNSFFLAQPRGPGGQRRPLQGFSQLSSLARDPRVGLLLSTSSARDSHEWSAYQAGVFSHQVRSGLHGAADVDGDGQISYREIAAFVTRANAAIPNERFRPEVYARPPRQSSQLLDLRLASGRRLHIDGTRHGHYLLEDGAGVRLSEFHTAPGQALTLVLPAPAHEPATGQPGPRPSRPLYLHEVGKSREYLLPPAASPGQVLELASLTPHAPAVGSRGAAHEAFSLIFTLPFERRHAEAHALNDDGLESGEPDGTPVLAGSADRPARALSAARRRGLWASAGVGGAALATGLALTLSARSLNAGLAEPNVSGQDVARVNSQVRAQEIAAPIFYGLAGAAAVTAVTLWLWPSRTTAPGSVRLRPILTPLPGGAAAGVGAVFGGP